MHTHGPRAGRCLSSNSHFAYFNMPCAVMLRAGRIDVFDRSRARFKKLWQRYTESMPTEETLPELEPLDEAWREIDDLVNQIARLSKSDAPKGEFYARAIDAVMRGLKAAGAPLWVRSAGEKAQLAYQVLPPEVWPGETQVQRPQLIELVLETGQAGILPPGCPPAADPRAANPTPYLLIVCPWIVEGEVAGVLEVAQASRRRRRGPNRVREVP